jgi:hypothetical protein
MIRKIISGGQPGAERAALDLAIKMEIPYGGWIARGRLTENGALPDTYKLKEVATPEYSTQVEGNVRDSDGTFILTRGRPTDPIKLTKDLVVKLNRPYLLINLYQMQLLTAATTLNTWIKDRGIEILHVTGYRTSEDPGIYQDTFNILESTIFLSLMQGTPAGFIQPSRSRTRKVMNENPPQTVREAVDRLVNDLSLKDRITLANMTVGELGSLQITLGRYIREKFGLVTGNNGLMASCRFVAKKDVRNEREASAVIIEKLWKKLVSTHKMRIIK